MPAPVEGERTIQLLPLGIETCRSGQSPEGSAPDRCVSLHQTRTHALTQMFLLLKFRALSPLALRFAERTQQELCCQLADAGALSAIPASNTESIRLSGRGPLFGRFSSLLPCEQLVQPRVKTVQRFTVENKTETTNFHLVKPKAQ
jgi:hypothetical protein